MTVQERVDALGYWYHKIDLGGIVTPGWAPLCVDAYQFPKDLTGKRVLDVGAFDGFWTFEALKRGAKEVLAIDDFSDLHVLGVPKDRPRWATFDLCREVLGYSEQQCQREEMSVYDAIEEKVGRFDIVLFYGVLYHCRYPLLALDTLVLLTNEIRIESGICDQFSAHRGGLGQGYGNQKVMEFYSGREYGDNPTNWWLPTLQTLGEMTAVAGWNNIFAWRLTNVPNSAQQARGFIIGKRERDGKKNEND